MMSALISIVALLKLLFAVILADDDSKPCAKLHLSEDHIVCVCNATYCDEYEPLNLIPINSALVFTTSKGGDRLEQSTVSIVADGKMSNGTVIIVDASKAYQEIFGFGGAFTDSTGINIASLDEHAQSKLMKSYFTEIGLEYNMGRVPVASTDFSTHVYSYDDISEDLELRHFNLTKEDLEFKIPYIISAMNLTKNNLALIGSPWSAPAWMKDTGKMVGGGRLIQQDRYFKSYANYLKKFFEAYNSHGIPFWGLTVQNEPSSGSDPDWKWQTMMYTAESMRDFIKTYLGPTLQTSNATRNLKVMILDDIKLLLPIAVHWYWNRLVPSIVLKITHDRYPEKFILASEASSGYFPVSGPILGDWYRAENYAKDIITDLNNYVIAFCDWNLALDKKGGPSWASNFLDAAIIVNARNGEFYKNPIFYAIGHFSKFFPRGSVRVDTSTKGDDFGLSAVSAVQRGRRRTTILNQRDIEQNLTVLDKVTNRYIPIHMPKRSIVTLAWDK